MNSRKSIQTNISNALDKSRSLSDRQHRRSVRLVWLKTKKQFAWCNLLAINAQDHQALKGPRRPYPSEGKINAALEFLVNKVINDPADNDAGGSHARDWKQKLLELINAKRIVSCEILQGTA